MDTNMAIARETMESRFKSRWAFVEFWLIFFLPWVLDFLTKQRAFTSVIGAFIWGVSVALAVARIKTLDPKLKSTLNRALFGAMGLWFLIFLSTLFAPESALIAPKRLPDWLLIAHAGLLAAGAGMVLCNLISACLWLLQNEWVRRPSMERRNLKWALPSLESLGKLSRLSVDLALVSWGSGFLIAMINAILKWGSSSDRFGWFSDPKVLVSALLWISLVLQFQMSHFGGRGDRRVFWGHVLLSLCFLSCFILFLVFGNLSRLHEPISWFSR